MSEQKPLMNLPHSPLCGWFSNVETLVDTWNMIKIHQELSTIPLHQRKIILNRLEALRNPLFLALEKNHFFTKTPVSDRKRLRFTSS
jgi:hypothetical protein